MALYLIHEPLLKWMAFAIKKWRKEHIDEFYMKRIQATPLSPLWGNIIILLVSPFLAWMLTKWFEEPMRRSLRTS